LHAAALVALVVQIVGGEAE
jgi:hypothetical protein